ECVEVERDLIRERLHESLELTRAQRVRAQRTSAVAHVVVEIVLCELAGGMRTMQCSIVIVLERVAEHRLEMLHALGGRREGYGGRRIWRHRQAKSIENAIAHDSYASLHTMSRASLTLQPDRILRMLDGRKRGCRRHHEEARQQQR